MQPCDPTAEDLTATANVVFITLLDKLSASMEIQLLGRLHNDQFKIPPGVRLQIRLTNA